MTLRSPKLVIFILLINFVSTVETHLSVSAGTDSNLDSEISIINAPCCNFA